MKKLTAAATAAVLVFATLALAGCTSWFESPAKPANDAIAVANQHLKKASSIESEISSGTAALQNVAYTKSGAADALVTISGITDALISERTELLAAKAAMDGIAKLDVTASFKEYAKLESAAIDARVALVDANSRLYAGMRALYTALVKTGNTVDSQDTVVAIQQMQKEVAALADSASQAAKSASDFFTANKLGG
jgi:hypothetical protein